MGSRDSFLFEAENAEATYSGPVSKDRLSELYSENVTAKILRAASDQLVANYPPAQYPETVPQSGPNQGRYESREVDFWTCGFFPGCIYSLFERAVMHPHTLRVNDSNISLPVLRQKLKDVGHIWSEPIHTQALRTDTHDLGFVILPHMRPRWELLHDSRALETIVTAAESLYQRYDPQIRAIRSWDTFDWHDGINITNMKDDFLVIIDSMCNMDLLFYAAAQSGNQALAEAAVAHSRTLLKSHLRVETAARNGYSGVLYSTPHLVNFSPATGMIKEVRTAQGYSKNSTWSRGQAWGILGYAQSYHWSGHAEFLDAACGLVEYFLLRLDDAPKCVEIALPEPQGRRVGRYVPLWDFDAPIDDPQNPLRDTSAGVIAANGMLILSQDLAALGKQELSARYLEGAMRIVEDTLELALAKEKAQLIITASGDVGFEDAASGGERFDSILKHATVCYNAASFRKNKASDTGLVYADYYLIEFGTRLLRMGIL
ncbi:Fc.00g105320.m01.CDS01 [Cosmosporella sp. VM-42]